MNKVIEFGMGAAVAAIAQVGAIGIASAAPDVVGQPYADAAAAIEEEGGTADVAVTVGGRLPLDECIVTNAWDASGLRPMTDDVYYEFADNEVMLSVNCNGGHATAANPGASVASPLGREAKAAADEAAAAQNEQDELAMVGETPGAPGE